MVPMINGSPKATTNTISSEQIRNRAAPKKMMAGTAITTAINHGTPRPLKTGISQSKKGLLNAPLMKWNRATSSENSQCIPASVKGKWIEENSIAHGHHVAGCPDGNLVADERAHRHTLELVASVQEL